MNLKTLSGMVIVAWPVESTVVCTSPLTPDVKNVAIGELGEVEAHFRNFVRETS